MYSNLISLIIKGRILDVVFKQSNNVITIKD